MNLFHWKTQDIDLFVVDESESRARATILANVKAWTWQNPERFNKVLVDLMAAPYCVAGPGYVISIDGAENSNQFISKKWSGYSVK